jgi:hypothetical protein
MISLHITAISAGSAHSNSDAIIACEYPIHCPSRSYSTIMHNTVDYRTTLLFNFKTQKRRKRSAKANPDEDRQEFGDYDPPERGFINRKVNM